MFVNGKIRKKINYLMGLIKILSMQYKNKLINFTNAKVKIFIPSENIF